MINTTNLEEAIEPMITKAGYEREQLVLLQDWLDRGDDVIVFELADLGAIGSGRPLLWVMPWERDRETPRQAPDTDQCGLGWRYLPAVRVTVADSDVVHNLIKRGEA